MILDGCGSHLEQLHSAHRPVIESTLRSTPVVVVGLIVGVESSLILSYTPGDYGVVRMGNTGLSKIVGIGEVRLKFDTGWNWFCIM